MTKYTWNDIVRVKPDVKHWWDYPGNRRTGPRIGDRAWVISVELDPSSHKKAHCPDGVVYGIEWEDGDTIQIHELDLELIERPGGGENA
jgi:hypothetical protein